MRRPLSDWALIVPDAIIVYAFSFIVAWIRDRGERCDAENAMAKFWATEVAVRYAQKTITVFGA